MKLEVLMPDVNADETWLDSFSDAGTGFSSCERLNLNSYLLNSASSTFYVKIKGNAMSSIGILEGDILVVDKSVDPVNNFTAIIRTNEEYSIKRLSKYENKLYLIPENADHKRIEITSTMNVSICGVVTSVVRKLYK